MCIVYALPKQSADEMAVMSCIHLNELSKDKINQASTCFARAFSYKLWGTEVLVLFAQPANNFANLWQNLAKKAWEG